MKTISRLEFNILPEMISRLLFRKSELKFNFKFNNVEVNFAKLLKCDKIHICCPNSKKSM